MNSNNKTRVGRAAAAGQIPVGSEKLPGASFCVIVYKNTLNNYNSL